MYGKGINKEFYVKRAMDLYFQMFSSKGCGGSDSVQGQYEGTMAKNSTNNFNQQIID